MTKKVAIIGTLASIFLAASVYAVNELNHDHTQTLCEGFIPENDMKIPVGFTTLSGQPAGISQAEFNEAMDRLVKYYLKDVEAQGLKLRINRLWENETVNASAQRSGSTQVLNMYGGLARHPQITFEGFSLVLCHEFGHHNGGAPKNGGWFGSWATNEGGSDYFATLKCLRRIFSEDDNAAIVAARSTELDFVAVEACTKTYPEDYDRDLCLRMSLAGQSVANFFANMKKDEKAPRFDTPDLSEVSRTNNNHPATQCRLDTYFAGMLCPVKETDKVSDTDYQAGSCYKPRDVDGTRPRCWFSPR